MSDPVATLAIVALNVSSVYSLCVQSILCLSIILSLVGSALRYDPMPLG